jgi:hypothetical protein
MFFLKEILSWSVLVKDHQWERDSQLNGFFRTDKHTGITMPAFFGIGHFGFLSFYRSKIHITLTGLSTFQTPGTQFIVYNRWHGSS